MRASRAVGFWSLFEAWRWPVALTLAQLQQQIRWRRAAVDWLMQPRVDAAAWPASAVADAASGWLVVPIEVLRAQHAAAVRAGWLPFSTIESARLGRALESIERLTLGSLARHR